MHPFLEWAGQRRCTLLRLAAAGVILTVATPVLAQPRTTGWSWSNTAYAQLNPRAFQDEIRLTLRLPLSDEPTPLAGSVAAFVGLGIGPGALRPVVGLELQPISPLSLGVAYLPTYYPNLVGATRSYPSPHSEYDSGVFSSPREGPSGSGSLFSHQLLLSASLRWKLDWLVGRIAVQASRFWADLPSGDRVYYEPTYDVVVDAHGWVAQNDVDLGVQLSPALILGVRHTLTLAWYRDAAYAPGESRDNPNTPMSRVGPEMRWAFFDRATGAESGSVFVLAQWYLVHRYRTGEAVSGAVPLLGIGFTLTGGL
jgi:hypothetical protein